MVVKKKTSKKKSKKKKKVWKPPPGEKSRFPKGVSGNPNGRPKGSKNRFSIAELWDAINKVEKDGKKGRKKLLIAFVEQSYDNPTVMIALMKKLLPDLKSIEGTLSTFESAMDDDLATTIQKKLKQRWAQK